MRWTPTSYCLVEVVARPYSTLNFQNYDVNSGIFDVSYLSQAFQKICSVEKLFTATFSKMATLKCRPASFHRVTS